MIKKILLASNPFKEHLTSSQVNENLRDGILKSGFKGTCSLLSVSDGGTDTITILEKLKSAQSHQVNVCGPEGSRIKAKYITFYQDGALTSFIEYSSAAGIKYSRERNALLATSFGIGEMIKHALNLGCKQIYIGLGDSATTDCGMGILQALGVVFYDSDGEIISDNRSELIENIEKVDYWGVFSKIKKTGVRISCLCDGVSSIGGEDGSWMRARNKGASDEEVERLKNGVLNFIGVVDKEVGINLERMPMTGCAGGVAGGLRAFLGAQLLLGSETVLDLLDFDSLLESHDLVITGEGIIDKTTFTKKAPHEIALRAKKRNVPVIAVASQINCDTRTLTENGIDLAFRTELQNYRFDDVRKRGIGPKLLRDTGFLIGTMITKFAR